MSANDLIFFHLNQRMIKCWSLKRSQLLVLQNLKQLNAFYSFFTSLRDEVQHNCVHDQAEDDPDDHDDRDMTRQHCNGVLQVPRFLRPNCDLENKYLHNFSPWIKIRGRCEWSMMTEDTCRGRERTSLWRSSCLRRTRPQDRKGGHSLLSARWWLCGLGRRPWAESPDSRRTMSPA